MRGRSIITMRLVIGYRHTWGHGVDVQAVAFRDFMFYRPDRTGD